MMRPHPTYPLLIAAWLFTTLRSTAAPSPLPLAPDGWLGDPMLWKTKAGGLVFAGDRTAIVEYRRSPVSRRATVKADITVQETLGNAWKIAAVAIVRDTLNFWHIALVEAPDTTGKTHHFELSEMRDGAWLAQHNLRVDATGGTARPWRTGETYRLTLTVNPSGIEGTVQDLAGETLFMRRIAFSAPAVMTGRPALRCGGFEATYVNVCGETIDAVQERAEKPVAVPYTAPSFVKTISGEKTGFFHVEQQGDLWWVIDPLGRGYVPLGVDHVRYSGHWCSTLGHFPHEKRNNDRYPDRDAWAGETLARLQGWGFNLLTAGSEPALHHRGMAHTIPLGIGSKITESGEGAFITPHEKRPCTAFPNVFHPDFERFCRYEAERLCRPHANDPWLFGFFLDNELAWWGRSWGDHGLETGLFDAVMKLDAGHTAKLALRDHLSRFYENSVERFNADFGTTVQSFDSVRRLTDLTGADGKPAAVLKCKGQFAGLVAERYFGTITRAIRAADPNHMILGCRFAGGRACPAVWDVAGKYCDICSFNYYGNVDLDGGVALGAEDGKMGPPLPEVFAKFHAMSKRPMMVTEWSFPALDAGLPSTHGAGQRFRTQAERAKATGIFAETILRMPFMVGYDYFMWVDEPALGITPEFPENSNYGLINENSEPYKELVATFSMLHRRAAALRLEGLKGLPAAAPIKDRPREIAAWLKAVKAPARGHRPDLYTLQEGKVHVARTKYFELRATIGGSMLTDRLLFNGIPLGRYNGLVQIWKGHRNNWSEVRRLTAVDMSANADTLTVLLTGTGPVETPFDVTYRLTLFADKPWFLAELVTVGNTGEHPLDMRAVFFRLHSALGGSADGDLPITQDAAPRLWGRLPGDAWVDAQAGVFWGAAAPRGSDMQIHFWLNEQGGQHPDAWREIEYLLEPGETFRPGIPTFVAVLAGKGGAAEWDRALQALMTP